MSTIDLDRLHLDSGSHASRQSGVCVMEAVAWYAGENHSDMPACVSPMLQSYGMRLNDRLPDGDRQKLKQFIPALVGTAGDGKDERRREIASQVLMTEWLPAWLRLAKLDDLAVQAEAGAGLQGAELRRALYEIKDLTYKERLARRDALKVRIQAELTAKWAAKPPVAAYVAAAADAAAAADVAVVVVAAAAAYAAADAAADAAVVAAAAFSYGSDGYWKVREAVYAALRKHYETSDAFAQVRALRDAQLQAGIDLYARLIEAVA